MTQIGWNETKAIYNNIFKLGYIVCVLLVVEIGFDFYLLVRYRENLVNTVFFVAARNYIILNIFIAAYVWILTIQTSALLGFASMFDPISRDEFILDDLDHRKYETC